MAAPCGKPKVQESPCGKCVSFAPHRAAARPAVSVKTFVTAPASALVFIIGAPLRRKKNRTGKPSPKVEDLPVFRSTKRSTSTDYRLQYVVETNESNQSDVCI